MSAADAATDLPDLAGLEVTAIAAENSLGFLQAAFDCTAGGRVFAIDKGQVALGPHVAALQRAPLPAPAQTGWGQLSYSPQDKDDIAQITFTSGTEGAPKAILLSHRNLGDVVTRLNEVMQVTGEIREYIGVPVTFSFGLGRARAVSAAGGRFFLPERFDPAEIARMLQAGEINAISAVPSLWSIILANPEVIGAAGEAVRWIEIGSQYMSGADKAALRTLFPKARIVQHYGLTEASRSTFLVISEAEGAALESVGKAYGAVELSIGAEEAICIRGPHVARALLNQETGQLLPLTDAQGWLVTKDKGALSDGYLSYHGRLDDQINVAGVKLGAEALEREIAATLPGLAGQFAIGKRADAARGEALVLGSEADPDQGPLLQAATELALKSRGIEARGALDFLQLDALPRTGTNKLQRGRLADLLSQKTDPVSAQTTQSVALTSAQSQTAKLWTQVTGNADVSPQMTFYDLGGDSLSSVQVGLVMEKQGSPSAAVRATLEGKPLSEVADLMEGAAPAPSGPAQLSTQTAKTWAVNAVRGIMVLSVLVSHWGPGFFGRFGVAEAADQVLGPIYRLGTPGFALVFGLGLGAFLLPRFDSQPQAVLGRLWASCKLVLIGMLAIAAVMLLLNGLRGTTIDGQRVAFAFYSVLTYYALILALAPLWVPVLARLQAKAVILPGLAVLFWLGWQGALSLITQEPLQNPFELVRLMGVAGYNVFKMTMFVCMGAALGAWMARHPDPALMGRQLRWGGLIACIIFSAALFQTFGSGAFAGRGNPSYMTVPGLLLYLSFVALLSGIAFKGMEGWAGLSRLPRLVLQVLIVVGGMALPIYVLHGLVLPVRTLMVLGLGVPGSIALLASMGAFVVAMGYRGWRLHRMYFKG